MALGTCLGHGGQGKLQPQDKGKEDSWTLALSNLMSKSTPDIWVFMPPG